MPFSNVYSPFLIPFAAFVAGALLMWLISRRTARDDALQITSLRESRLRLAGRLKIIRERLDEISLEVSRLRGENRTLGRIIESLEAEQAQMVSAFANLGAGVGQLPVLDDEADEVIGPISSDMHRSMAATVATGGVILASMPGAGYSSAVGTATIDATADQTVEGPPTMAAIGEVDDMVIDGPTAGQLASTGPTMRTRDRSSDADHDIEDDETQSSIPADWLEAVTIAGTPEPAQAEEDDTPDHPTEHGRRRELLTRDAEISRLRAQLAPLLGLPLAISAREAERDRLARRLSSREQELTQMKLQLAQLRDREDRLLRTMREQGVDAANAWSDPDASTDESSSSDGQTHDHIDVGQDLDMPSLPTAGSDRREPWIAMGTLYSGSSREAASHIANGGQGALSSGSASRAALIDTTTGIESAYSLPTGDLNYQVPRQYSQPPEQIDNLKRIRGIGPVLERMLNRLGVYQYRQIANWTAEDIAWFDGELAEFRGRIERDGWVDSAEIEYRRKYIDPNRMH